MIFTCKQIARKMADQKLHETSPIQRWWMKLHIKMCVVCGSYQRDAEKFQHAESKFAELDEDYQKKMNPDFKERLKAQVRESQKEEK